MNGMKKIKLLKELLDDGELVSKKILRNEEPEGKLIVTAEGDSPEDAKEEIIKQLQGIDLPDEEEMEDEMPEMEDEMPEMEDEEEMDEDEMDLAEEDADILEMLPEKSRKEFKKRLMEKIKSL